MRNAIIVSGLICSGKSTLINHLSRTYNWDVVSFGEYIKYHTNKLKAKHSRESYQKIGQDLFSTLGANKFLEEVIAHRIIKTNIHIFDGVRHLSIVSSIQYKYEKIFIIFLETDNLSRYNRCKQREGFKDNNLSFKEFLELDKHHTEKEVIKIKQISDLCIDASLSIDNILKKIHKLLDSKGFIV